MWIHDGNANIVAALRNRELGLRKNLLHSSRGILRTLITKKGGRKFKKIYGGKSVQISRSNNVHYISGRLFTENFSTCYSIEESNVHPTLLYKMHNCKFSQALFYQTSNQELHSNSDRNSGDLMIGIDRRNFLSLVDLRTGLTIKNVCLSVDVNFKYMDWNQDQTSFYIMSTISKGRDEVCQALLFTVDPFQFVARISFCKSAFGPLLTGIQIGHDTVLALFSNNKIQVYSLPLLLEKYCMFSVKLGETCHQQDGAFVGGCMFGLPVNVVINSPVPAPLLHRKTANHYLACSDLGYFISAQSECAFQVLSLRNNGTIKNGDLIVPQHSIEPAKCHFMNDDSCRVYSVGANVIRVYDIMKNEDMEKEDMEKEDMETEDMEKEECSLVPSFSILGKHSKAKFDLSSYPALQQFDYEDHLDVFTVVSCPENERSEFLLLCPHTGKAICRVPLHQQFSPDTEDFICLDLDSIVYLSRKNSSRSSWMLTVYQLTEIFH